MIRMFITFSFIGIIQGCTTSSEVFLSDGSKGYYISCDGTMINYGHCLQKAGEICGARGYLVANQQGDVIPFSMASGSFGDNNRAASAGFSAQSGTIITRGFLLSVSRLEC